MVERRVIERRELSATLPAPTVETPSRLGLTLAVGLAVGAGAATLVLGLGSLAGRAYILAVVVTALVLVRRRQSPAYLEFVLWTWFLGPEVRRVVDYRTGWHDVSPIMLAAPLATLIALGPALLGRRRLHADGARAMVIALAAVVYAALVGALKAGVTPAAAAAVDWLAPVAIGLYVAGAGPDTPVLHAALRRTAVLGSAVLGLYGALQYFVLPAWDAFWMQNAPLSSAGFPHPLQVRVFSTLNAPSPFAITLGVLLLLALTATTRHRWLALTAGFLSFGLSLVRMAWLGFLVAVGLLFTGRGARRLRIALLVILIPVVLFAAIGGPAAKTVTDRLQSSTRNGASDQSLSARVSFHRHELPIVSRDVVGHGLGSIGTATKLTTEDPDPNTLTDFDGGALEVLYVFGVGVGLALLLSLLVAVHRSWRRTRGSTELPRAAAAALWGLTVQLLFGNSLGGPAGIMFWLLLGMLARDEGTEALGTDAASMPGHRLG